MGVRPTAPSSIERLDDGHHKALLGFVWGREMHRFFSSASDSRKSKNRREAPTRREPERDEEPGGDVQYCMGHGSQRSRLERRSCTNRDPFASLSETCDQWLLVLGGRIFGSRHAKNSRSDRRHVLLTTQGGSVPEDTLRYSEGSSIATNRPDGPPLVFERIFVSCMHHLRSACACAVSLQRSKRPPYEARA